MNRSVTSWALYDVANTVFNFGVVGLFLPLWINHREGTTDADLGFPIAISMAIVLIASPLLGALTDQLKSRIRTLTLLNISGAIATFAIGLTDNVQRGLIFFIVSFVCIYLAEMVYNTLLSDASTSSNRGKIGGIAIGVGNSGSLVVIAFALLAPGTSGNYSFEFKMIAVFFLLTALPITIFFKESQQVYKQVKTSAIKATLNQLKLTRDHFKEHPNLVRFFIARYLYMVAVTTATTFGVLYGIKTIGFSERQVQFVLLTGILIAIPSAFMWGYIVDRIGTVASLRWVILFWSISLAGAVAIPWLNLNNQLWWLLSVLMGLCFSGLWVADRPLLIHISPTKLGEMFGIYGTVSRLAFLTGSFVWSIIVDSIGLGQPSAVVFLLFCSVAGLGVLTKLNLADSPAQPSN